MLGKRGCRIQTGLTIAGYEALILENDRLRVVILPEKGTDIVEFLYKPKDWDFTWSTSEGLREKGSADGFIDQYEGGWQEIFPNGGTPSRYKGAAFGQHDEVALLPWHWRTEENSPDAVSVAFEVDTIKSPFRMRKTLRLSAGEAELQIDERLENRSPFPQEAMWGHHFAYGPPFLGAGCRIETSARTVLVLDEPAPTRRFVPGRYPWPHVLGTDGLTHDLRTIPDTAQWGDIVYLTDFREGAYALVNEVACVKLVVQWDERILPHCWFWQNYRADGYPWYGREYNIGLEPFCGYPTHGIEEAIANGSALRLEGLASVMSGLRLRVEEC